MLIKKETLLRNSVVTEATVGPKSWVRCHLHKKTYNCLYSIACWQLQPYGSNYRKNYFIQSVNGLFKIPNWSKFVPHTKM